MAVSLKKHVSLPLVINGCVSSLVLLLGMMPTFGAFTATIAGTLNSAGSGTIVMQEADSSGAITCLSTDGGGISVDAAACSSINKYGGSQGMRPGDTAVVVTYIRNVGTVAASAFSLTPGACTQSATSGSAGSALDLCSKIGVSITSGSNTIYSGTAAALGGVGTIDVLGHIGLPRIVPGAQATITVTTTMDASINNSYMGLKVSQPMTWTFTA